MGGNPVLGVHYWPHYLPAGTPVTTMFVTPDVAREWLHRSSRVICDAATIRRYAAIMRDRRFRTDSLFILGEDGTLLDGHHRCWALLDAGIDGLAIRLAVLG
jgi:hypothetical protein